MSRTSLHMVLVSVLVCLGCLSLQSAFAQVTMQIPKPCDLVVQRLVFLGFEQHGDFQQANLRVRVKNVGSGPAPPCTVAVCYMRYVVGEQNPTMVVATAQTTEPLPAGEGTPVEMSMLNVSRQGLPWAGLLLAVVDPPTQQDNGGDINEHGLLVVVGGAQQDANNCFGVILNGGVMQPMTRWDNPAVK